MSQAIDAPISDRPFFSWLIFLAICLVPAVALAQEFRTVGYLPYYRFGHLDDLALDKLTHLNIAFANPDAQGNLSVSDTDIFPVVDAAHAVGAEVFISLAGGALTTEWANAWENLIRPQNRSAFIHKILEFVQTHNLQGVDNDLEWSHVDDNYSGFVLELRDSLDVYGLQLTAALPGTYRYPQISDAALEAYDWINMMVYDLTGPWAPNNPGPHSPYSFALNAIDYWMLQDVTPDRLTLGVPFYGWDFTDQQDINAWTYRYIVNLDPANAQTDQAGLIYYNGIPTIEAKTMLALNEVSGIMIWEIGQDHFSELSLLDALHAVIESTISSVASESRTELAIYPNPITDIIEIQSNDFLDGILRLINLQGQVVLEKKCEGISEMQINASELPSGTYVCQVISDNAVLTVPLIKL